MSLSYIGFLNKVKDWVSAVQLTGVTVSQWTQICLEDEIELNPSSRYPGCFITPLPFYQNSEFLAQYNCRVYMVSKIELDRSDRFTILSQMVSWAQACLQNIPDEFNGIIWPIQIIPVVFFDLNGDGIYFDISLTNQIDCYIS